MDLRLWLVASTCAGYDDDAQICCEHGGEGGQNVSLSMLLFFSQQLRYMKTWMTGGGGGSCHCCFFMFVAHFFLLLISFPIFNWFSISQRGSLKKAGGGKREPPAVGCSSRNAA